MTDETEELKALRAFVKFISTDYIELSHEKVTLQRNDYINGSRKLCKKYEINEIEPTHLEGIIL